ncbi:MAG: hypothetical protein ACM31O_04495 [Bacteroidota bacterium]
MMRRGGRHTAASLRKAVIAELDWAAIYLIGEPRGPVRLGITNDPDNQLAVIRRNCTAADTEIRYEGWAPRRIVERIEEAVLQKAAAKGMILRKSVLQLTAEQGRREIERTVRIHGLVLADRAGFGEVVALKEGEYRARYARRA